MAGRPTGRALASDGEYVFAVVGANLQAIAISDQASWRLDLAHATALPLRCQQVVVDSETLFVACVETPNTLEVETCPLAGDCSTVTHVFAIDASNQLVTDHWQSVEMDYNPLVDPLAAGDWSIEVQGMAANDDLVVLTTWSYSGLASPEINALVIALDRATLDLRWVLRPGTFPLADADGPFQGEGGSVALQDDKVLVAGSGITAYTSDGAVEWRHAAPEELVAGTSKGLAVSSTWLYFGHDATLSRVNSRTGALDWTAPLPFDVGRDSQAILAGGHIYINAANGNLFVANAADGEVTAILGAGQGEAMADTFAIGDGTLVLLSDAGTLSVYGETPIGIKPRIHVESRFPGVGETVKIDVAQSVPGALSDDLVVDIGWGDGSSTSGPRSSDFTHAYDAAGPVTVQVTLSNSAGQSAARTVELDVGGTPETFLSRAFSPPNQETTFFVLGIAFLLMGSAFGVLRLRRKRGILQRELRAIDTIIAETKDDAPALQAALRERRAHARGLLADGKIEDAHFTVLERYLDDASTRTRVGTMESELPFLPLGLAQALKEMLGDAKITDWEHRHFVDAVAKDSMLTAAQKRRVQRLVDAWFEQDVGVGA